MVLRDNYFDEPYSLGNWAGTDIGGNTVWSNASTSGVDVFVLPNEYETKRGHIVVYNWDSQGSVTADITSLGLQVGDTYILHNAQNYVNETTTGTYDGQSISVPMTSWSMAAPIGASGVIRSSTFPQFGVFVLIGGGSSITPPPYPTETPGPTPTSPPYPTETPGPTPTLTSSPYSTPTPPPVGVDSLTLLFRQQGITEARSSYPGADHKVTLKLKRGSSLVFDAEVDVTADENGIWTGVVEPGTNNPLSSGNYNLLIKGDSHLQKKFESITLTGGASTQNLAQGEADELVSGDVNDDNVINIDDIAQIKRFYTDFKVPVVPTDPDSRASDINKDGSITITDLALMAINWTKLTVAGDE